MTSSRLRPLAIAAAALTIVLPTGAYAGGEDSPWPDSDSNRVQLSAARRVVHQLEDKVELMELSAARYAAWETCIRGVPVSEYGDPDRQSGYAYDERDGSGRSFMPALAVDRRRRLGREDYLFLDFARTRMCRSQAPEPGGTADAASARRGARAGPTVRPGRSLGALERRARRLRRAVKRLLAASERFDAWESCVSWVPVTEYGDPDGGFGYLFGARGSSAFSFRPALSIDRSDWDDPTTCSSPSPAAIVRGRPARTSRVRPLTDPRGTLLAAACALTLLAGAAAATPAVAEDPPSTADRIEELQQDLDSLIEDVEDLREPVAEFDLFDECTYPIGVSEYGTPDGALGFAFGRAAMRRRPALALDIRGFGRPGYQFLAFPAEEPPSIECNEDAGQEASDG